MKRSPSTTSPTDPAAALAADGLMSVKEALAFLSIGHSELYAMMGRGELPSCKIGRRRLIPRKALVAFAARHLVNT